MPVPAQAKYIEANGLRLAYIEQGKGPLVILLHGFPDTVDTWQRTMKTLAGAGFRAVALSMRGWPPSDIPADHEYSVRNLANDALRLIEHLNMGPAFIIGHDWGAFAAYAAATIKPTSIKGVVTSGLPPIAVYKESLSEKIVRPHHVYLAWGKVSAWLIRRRNFRKIDQLYARWSPHYRASPEHMAQVKTALALKGRAQAAVGYYWKPMQPRDRQQFTQPIRVPGLVFYGSDEPPVRQEMFRKTPSAFAGQAKLVRMLNVGHWPHLENPDQFEAELLEFLRGL